MDIKRLILITGLCVLVPFLAKSQLKGHVQNESGIGIPALLFAEGTNKTVYANAKGDFQLKLKKGRYLITCFAEGYNTESKSIVIGDEEVTLNFTLSSLSIEMSEVVIAGSR